MNSVDSSVRNPAYVERLRFYVRSATVAYRRGAALQLMEAAARSTGPVHRLTFASDALKVVGGHMPALEQPQELGPESAARLRAELTDALSLYEGTQRARMATLGQEVIESLGWPDFDAMAASEFGARKFSISEEPEQRNEYDKWFEVASGYLPFCLPHDPDQAADVLGSRIDWLVDKIAADPATDLFGLRDVYRDRAAAVARQVLERLVMNADEPALLD